jgi:hypothetical protein
MRILSFDCGHESMGVTLLNFDSEHLKTIDTIITEDFITRVHALRELNRLQQNEKILLINYIFDVISSAAIYLGKLITLYITTSVKLVDSNVRALGLIGRANGVKYFLKRLDMYCKDKDIIPDIVLIEDQTINNISGEVASQVAFHYSHVMVQISSYPEIHLPEYKCSSDYRIVIMDPRKKNQIAFDPCLCIDMFYKKYIKSYDANKAHTRANFLYFIEAISAEDMLHGVPSKRKKDIADSFMQVIAYIRLS